MQLARPPSSQSDRTDRSKLVTLENVVFFARMVALGGQRAWASAIDVLKQVSESASAGLSGESSSAVSAEEERIGNEIVAATLAAALWRSVTVFGRTNPRSSVQHARFVAQRVELVPDLCPLAPAARQRAALLATPMDEASRLLLDEEPSGSSLVPFARACLGPNAVALGD